MLQIKQLISEDLTPVRLNNNLYTTQEHDSLRIFVNTNSWFWYNKKVGGNCVNWLMYYHNLDKENAELYLQEYDDNSYIKFQHKQKEDIPIYEVYQFAGKKRYADYLTNFRKLTPETIDKYNLEYDSLTERAIIPIFNQNNKRIGATIRKIHAEKNERYRNFLNTLYKPALWPENDLSNTDSNNKIILFEGCWSVMRFWQVLHNIDSSLRFFSIFGSFPSKKIVEMLNGLSNIYFILDNDEAGLSLPDQLKAINLKCEYILPNVYPDEMTDKQILKVYERFIKK